MPRIAMEGRKHPPEEEATKVLEFQSFFYRTFPKYNWVVGRNFERLENL